MSEPHDLPRRWYTAGSHREFWGTGGTYHSVRYEHLPPLPARSKGLGWLAALPELVGGLGLSDSAVEADETPESLIPSLDQLEKEAKKLGLSIPASFRPFMTDGEIHSRVPSCTACYLELPGRLVPLADGRPGRLLRF